MTREELYKEITRLSFLAEDARLIGEAGVLQTVAAAFTSEEHLYRFSQLCMTYCANVLNEVPIGETTKGQNPRNG